MSLSSIDASFDSSNAENLLKKLLGENEVEAVLQRLDRLTQDEARTAAAQTLEVVYGLIQNMKVVMDGAQKPSSTSQSLVNDNSSLLDGKSSTDSIRDALSTFR